MPTFRQTLRLAIAALVLTACDVPPEVVIDAVPTQPGVQDPGCSDTLLESVTERAEAFSCHAECGELFVECLQLDTPACAACEHEAAICRSTCPDPALWAAAGI